MGDPVAFTSNEGSHTIFSLSMSCLIIVAMAVSISIYYFFSNYQRVNIQNDIRSIEGESELALFQLGNRISGGTPTEVAIEKSIRDMKDLKIAGLFRRCLHNIKTLGLTFEGALFNKQYGALKYYPSRLLKNIMRAVTDTAKRGLTYASESMLKIGRYMKNIRETQEYINDMLSDTVSSMKFQAYFLTPIITGLVVSMSQVIMKVLYTLGQYMQNAGIGEAVGISNMMGGFANIKTSMTSELFQLIIGVYMIQVVIILVMFITKINFGENKYQQQYEIGKTILISVAIYIIVALLSTALFGELIDKLVSDVLGA